MKNEQIFWELFQASVENDVKEVLIKFNLLRCSKNWRPYGQTFSNFSVVENQQSSPVPALVEKITNGIDAILMRRCLEQGIDPRSEKAPQSIEEAIEKFYPDHKNWDLRHVRRKQSESLQVIADGPRRETSLIIFDEGEGQAPEKFEETFLSLLRGNKNDIHFVQGKYNMGGAGAITFCGEYRYQLICSRRYDNPKSVGFTLVRRHPFTADEEKTKKSTWYEYLILDEKIPSFSCNELDLGLYNKRFNSGTVIKLYSYDLPEGARSVISRDLNQSINEYLFNPALPVFTIDTSERYPKDRETKRELYGLKHRLEEDEGKYIDQYFSEDMVDDEMGNLRVTCYVFKSRIENKTVKETQEAIQREFFKNHMSVIFSMNGQVHGHYTSEFITRSLKFSLLKNCLLIGVDCTNLRNKFRDELFMASRDRLKKGDESRRLRDKLAKLLSNGRLKDIHKMRKASITVESNDAEELVRNLARQLPIHNELMDLFNQTFKIDNRRKNYLKLNKNKPEQPIFSPKRYPSFLKSSLEQKKGEIIPTAGLPLGGEKIVRFFTDVEDHYFDRVQDPGELQVSLLDVMPNENDGGDQSGLPRDLATILNVVTSSPQDGVIRIKMKPTEKLSVGDAVKLQVSLSSPEGELSHVFLIKITEPTKKPNEPKKPDESDTNLGLPKLVMVYKDEIGGKPSWNDLEKSGISMGHDIVVHPFVDDDTLSTVYINMDSTALLSYRTKLKKYEAISVAEKRYVSAVYFHTLFLYTITRNRKYGIIRQNSGTEDEPVGVDDYISDLFKSFYAEFLLSFDTQELISALEV